ncbi:Mitochondrial import inner membrane translocase subunit TIM23-2 [Capsicum baccatum]|uniref:Mitochondrial import inner membrane translocase subunit TIM23-2 n=1 Tax=Capsicum baccatum TaxID=33114 RepID=A0A2G2X9W5_CAPBA|nr:Mitochondrial import inner membrane translocase subunit TIM23-2 [Capsicum baccatum]
METIENTSKLPVVYSGSKRQTAHVNIEQPSDPESLLAATSTSSVVNCLFVENTMCTIVIQDGSGMVVVRDTDAVINSVVAGLGTGVFYRAAAGLRSAAVTGVIGGVVVGLGVIAKQAQKRYVPI